MIPFPPDAIPIYKARESARMTRLRFDDVEKEFRERKLDIMQRQVTLDASQARLKLEEANMEKIRKRFNKPAPGYADALDPRSYHAAVRNLDMMRANVEKEHQAIGQDERRYNADIAQLSREWRINEAKLDVIASLSSHLHGPLLVDLMKVKDARFRQSHFISKESKGACSAISLEYVHWRRAGKTALQTLEQLRSPSAMRRLQASQDILQERYFSMIPGAVLYRTSHPAANQAYVSVYAQHFNRLKHDFRLVGSADAGFSGTSAAELTVGGSIAPEFCFAMLTYLWPGNLYKPWLRSDSRHAWQQFKTLDGHAEYMMTSDEMDRHREATSSKTTTSSSASSSTTTTSVSPVLSSSTSVEQQPLMREKKGQSTRLPYEMKIHPDVREKKMASMDRTILMIQSDSWSRAISCELDCILNKHGHHGYLLCFLAIPAKWGHFIVIDFDRKRPGLFEPNCGFIPLPSCETRSPMLHWLLALFVFAYSVNRIDFMYVPEVLRTDD